MSIRSMASRLLVASVATTALASSLLVATSSPALAAYGTVCKTVTTSSQLSTAIIPRMTIPICYNGDRIWQNGNASAAVSTFGYQLNGIDWAGTYNGGGNWLGAGMNYRVSAWGNWWSFTCLTRWTFNAHGQQTSYDRGC